MPAGLLVTVPEPVPALVTVSVYARLKVAVTKRLLLMELIPHCVPPVTSHPAQPENVELPEAEAVRTIAQPWGKLAEHTEPQLMLTGKEVTVPEPVPVLVTLMRHMPPVQPPPPVIITVALHEPEPKVFEHVSPYVVVELIGPYGWEPPVVLFGPSQLTGPTVAVHEVGLFVVVHVNNPVRGADPEGGLAVSVQVGAPPPEVTVN